MDFSLWKKAATITQQAIRDGALQSLNTSKTQISEATLSFHIRVLEHLSQKTIPATPSTQPTSPFLVHDDALFVTNIGEKHKCLLNKFNVLEKHLLLVTRAFEEQTTALNLDDFVALHRCMSDAPVLAFYNRGKTAGASQTHKHLQLIKCPLQAEQLIPFTPQLQTLNDEVPRSLTTLPFRHAALALPKDLFQSDRKHTNDAGIQLQHLYDRLRMTLNIEKHGEEITTPYNLLLTQDWMLMVPRTQESFMGISLNALAFCGSILVKDEEQAQEIINAGLTNSLHHTS